MADIFPIILSGSIPTHFLPLYKVYGEIISPFHKSSSFQRHIIFKFSKLSKSPGFSHPFLKKSFENLSKGIMD